MTILNQSSFAKQGINLFIHHEEHEVTEEKSRKYINKINIMNTTTASYTSVENQQTHILSIL